MVLLRPISSAKHGFNPSLSIYLIHENPSFWYGLNVPTKPSGVSSISKFCLPYKDITNSSVSSSSSISGLDALSSNPKIFISSTWLLFQKSSILDMFSRSSCTHSPLNCTNSSLSSISSCHSLALNSSPFSDNAYSNDINPSAVK